MSESQSPSGEVVVPPWSRREATGETGCDGMQRVRWNEAEVEACDAYPDPAMRSASTSWSDWSA